jgi:ubiquinone/menaquinone biosynthesis C-methylase UbiE
VTEQNRMINVLRTAHKKLLRDTLGHTQHENLVRYIAPLLPDNAAEVLDIGCGNGLFSHLLLSAKPNLRIKGVEAVMRPDCRIECYSYDGNRLPVADKSFDYALLINVLHHVEDPARVLAEASRVARKGIIVKDHYANTRFDFCNLVVMEQIGNAFSGISQPYHFLSKNEWNALLEGMGLKTEKLLTRFISYNRLLDLFLGRNLHFIARLTPAGALKLRPRRADGP